MHVDEPLKKRGILVFHLPRVEVGGEVLRLKVVFPDLFPEARFEIAAENLALPKHQHPVSKYLCLLGRSTANWDVSNTVAGFIRDRIPLVLQTARAPDGDEAAARAEEHQGEPFATYFMSEPDSIFLVDSTIVLSGNRGSMRLMCARFEAPAPIRGQATEIRDRYRANCYTAAATSSAFSRPVEARWVKLGATPTSAALEDLWRAALAIDPKLITPDWRLLDGIQIDVIGIAFDQEVGYRQTGLGWVFFVRLRGKKKSVIPYLVRSANAGPADLRQRIPSLQFTEKHTVSIAGVGGLGAPSTLEFARAGTGSLHVLDGDYFDPGTSVRWPLGLGSSGLGKVRAIEAFCREHYPHANLKTFRHRLGGTRLGETRESDGRSDLEVLEEFLSGSSLVYDASAERGVHLILSRLAYERRIPYVVIAATPGGWGGTIARVVPGQTRCWQCLQHHLDDGTIPHAPFDDNGRVQPTGCADPTFTGVSFDLTEVALAGVRLAMATLSNGNSAAYPRTNWDVGVLSLRDEHGGLIPPSWKTYKLARHLKCAACELR